MSKREDARAQFERDVANHQMEVLLDNGVYRHLRFSKPGTFCGHFNIVTYPGTLVYTGDMGDFVFQRLNDMFQFFRTDTGRGDGINPGYWAEKLVAVDRRGFREFDEDLFTGTVMKYLVTWIRDNRDHTTKEDRRELWDAVVCEVINADGDTSGARKQIAAHDFWHQVNDRREFSFTDFWERNFESYTFDFYWACYAIAWAVKQYDVATAKREAA